MRCEGRGTEEQDLTDSLQSREAAGKPYSLLAGNGACDEIVQLIAVMSTL